MQATSVFLPGESHGQRSLAGYCPWGFKESDTTQVTEHTCLCSESACHPRKRMSASHTYKWARGQCR